MGGAEALGRRCQSVANLATAALAYGPDDPIWRERFVRWAAAFPHVMRCSLRGRRTLAEVAILLGEEEADRIASADHMPDVVAETLARMLRDARRRGMDPMGFFEAERQRGMLIDHLGGCERILATPLARASAIQVRRFILMFLLTLPLALLHDFGKGETIHFFDHVLGSTDWLVPIFVMLTAYPLLSLDRIGMELQNPFDTRRVNHLPLDTLCGTIERNLMDMLVRDRGVEVDVTRPPLDPKPDAMETQNLLIGGSSSLEGRLRPVSGNDKREAVWSLPDGVPHSRFAIPDSGEPCRPDTSGIRNGESGMERSILATPSRVRARPSAKMPQRPGPWRPRGRGARER